MISKYGIDISKSSCKCRTHWACTIWILNCRRWIEHTAEITPLRCVRSALRESALRVISQKDFASIVNSELMQGKNVNIISGVHGDVNGALVIDRSMFIDDVKRFGQIPGVKVFNYSELSPQQIKSLMQSSDTTIGGFCNSGTCLKK